MCEETSTAFWFKPMQQNLPRLLSINYLSHNTNVTGSDFSQGCGLVGWQSHSLLLLFYAFRDIHHVDER